MTKTDLYRLVDELPDSSIEAAAELLHKAATDPEAAMLLLGPWDDEPYTSAERTEDEAALADIDHGDGIPWETAKGELKAG